MLNAGGPPPVAEEAAHATVAAMPPSIDLEEQLAALRARADADFASPPAEHEHGRHTAELPALGLRVTLTRSLYPNRPGGADLYALTVSTIRVDAEPADPDVTRVLFACFGAETAETAQPRPGGPRVRMFRIPASPPPETRFKV